MQLLLLIARENENILTSKSVLFSGECEQCLLLHRVRFARDAFSSDGKVIQLSLSLAPSASRRPAAYISDGLQCYGLPQEVCETVAPNSRGWKLD